MECTGTHWNPMDCHGQCHMAIAKRPMTNDKWPMGNANGHLRLAFMLFGICHLALSIWHWPLGIGHLALAIWHWPFGIGHLALASWHWPLGIGHLALAIWHGPRGIGHLPNGLLGLAICSLAIWPFGICQLAIWQWPFAIGHSALAIRRLP